MNNGLYRILNEKEKQEFRQWAIDNYKINTEINELWHTVIKKQCEIMNNEYNGKDLK